jgi:hypothetical protein
MADGQAPADGPELYDMRSVMENQKVRAQSVGRPEKWIEAGPGWWETATRRGRERAQRARAGFAGRRRSKRKRGNRRGAVPLPQAADRSPSTSRR